MRAAKLNKRNSIFSVVCGSWLHKRKCGNFTLLFCRGRHGIVLKFVLHVQHAYFSSLYQTNNEEFKKWRQQRQRQRHKWMIWLVEWVKKSCCSCGTLFGAMFRRSLPNNDVKFSCLMLWRQREPAPVNLHSLPLHENHWCQAKESALRLFCKTLPT